jgi:very-short-patch-repair endonuclease
VRKLKILNFREPVVDLILRRRLSNEGFRIFAKIRLCDVINKEQGERLSDREFEYLSRAHLDFLIAKDNIPKFAVEFDGARHLIDAKTIERDVLKNKLCKMAELPLLRITVQEIEETEKITLLDYMLLRYITWEKEYEEIMSKIREYASNLPPNFDPEQLAIDLDPAFHFNIRHPFPGNRTIQERLWQQYQVAWEFSQTNRKNSAAYICGVFPSEFHYGHNQCDRCIVRAMVWKNGTSKENSIYSTTISASIRSWLPLNQKIPDWSEIVSLFINDNQKAETLLKKRFDSIWTPDLPGIDTSDIVQSYAEYLGFRAIEKWANKGVMIHNLQRI